MSDNIIDFGTKNEKPTSTGPAPSVYTIVYDGNDSAERSISATGYLVHYGEYITVAASADLSEMIVPLVAIRHARVLLVTSVLADAAA